MMRASDLVKILLRNGFQFIRSSRHEIYRRGTVTVAVPHEKTCSKGLCRRILQQAQLKHEINF